MPRKGQPKPPCSIDECEQPAKARSWCKTHWARWKRTGDPLGIRQQERVDVLERIMRKVAKQDDGCWIFTGHLNNKGYGQVNLGQHEGRALVHRVVYERLVGPIPDGLVPDHLCRVPACCNPAHLEPVTHAENVRRGDTPAVQRARFEAMTHCGMGHPRTPENIRVTKTGQRRCRPCVNEWARRARERKKAAA